MTLVWDHVEALYLVSCFAHSADGNDLFGRYTQNLLVMSMIILGGNYVLWNAAAKEVIWNGRQVVIHGRYVVVTSATPRRWFSSPIPTITPLLLPSSEWIKRSYWYQVKIPSKLVKTRRLFRNRTFDFKWIWMLLFAEFQLASLELDSEIQISIIRNDLWQLLRLCGSRLKCQWESQSIFKIQSIDVDGFGLDATGRQSNSKWEYWRLFFLISFYHFLEYGWDSME